jgi:MFS family permease
LGASAGAIGIIEGAAESMSSLLKLFAGNLSDRLGKRKFLVVGGYALAALTRPLLAFAGSWHQVLAIRLGDRVGKGIRSAPRDAMIADTVRIEQRGLAFGFHRAMDHSGAVIGPLIGYALVGLFAGNFTWIFLAAAIPGVIAVLVAVFVMRESPVEKQVTYVDTRDNAYTQANSVTHENRSGRGQSEAPPPLSQEAGATLRSAPFPTRSFSLRTSSLKFSLRGFDTNFKRFLLILALFTLSNSSDAFLILRARDSGVPLEIIPLLWSAHHASKVLSSLYGGDLSDRLGRKRLIVSGWVLYAAVYAGFAFVNNAYSVWALFLIYGLYFGLVEGAEKALVADLVRPDQRGTAYGLYNLAFGITVFPASLLMGMIWDWKGPATAFLVNAVMGAAAAILLLIFVQRRVENTAPIPGA